MKKNKTSVISFTVCDKTQAMMSEELDWCKRPTTPAYAKWQAKDGDTVITLYESGKAMFQGVSADIEASLWTNIERDKSNIDYFLDQEEKKEKKNKEEITIPLNISSIGSDEVGTGDYFGPIVVTASYVNKENIPLLKQNSRAKFHFVLGSILFVAFLIWVFYLVLVNGNISTQSKQSLLALALIFGFAFGFIISRGQICFTACFRDLFLFGRENAIKGALIGMIIASLIAFAFILHGHNSKLIELSPAVAIGAFLFGFGIVFAGGCECGWTYRACEGQSHFMIVGIANIIGTMILALTYDFLPSAFKEGVKINLLNEFGNLGGFFINLALFILMFACVLFYKKHFFQKLNQKG